MLIDKFSIQHEWKNLFPSHIWQRGENYYRDGHILELQHHGSMFTAEIRGTEVYTVSVTLDASGDRIKEYSCDCPCGEDGTPCKHFAALLCALEDVSLEERRINEADMTIEEAIALLSEQQVRELLLQLAQRDSDIRETILFASAKQLPISRNSQWEFDLQELTDAAENRHGYIEYEDAYEYCLDLQDYLEDRLPGLLSGGLLQDAFELTCLVFQTGMEQDMDDSDGGLSVIAGSCTNAWTEIMKLANPVIQREMFDWFTAHYSDSDVGQMFLDECIFDAPWREELIQDLLQFLDRQIQMCSEDDTGTYRLNDLIVRKIRWMEQSGADKQTIDEYITRYHHLSAVRDMQISQAMDNKDYETVLALLEESKELDKDKIGLVAKHSAKIIETYEKTGNIPALKRELEYYVFSFRQDDLVYTQKLKNLLTSAEWDTIRERLLESSSMQSQIYSLMELEGMYEQIMMRIEARTDIYSLERYESVLLTEFTERCRNVYLTYLRQAMGRASDRKAYWSVIQVLKKLRKYPDGETAAQNMADEWKKEYPRRSSMLDELRKAGY